MITIRLSKKGPEGPHEIVPASPRYNHIFLYRKEVKEGEVRRCPSYD